MKFSDFLDKFDDRNDEHHYYLAESELNKNLEADINEPNLTKQLLELDRINLWMGHGGTVSSAHTDSQDNLMCIVTGFKRFYIVSPFHGVFLSRGYNRSPLNYSPINFAEPDLKKFPSFANA